MCVKSILVGMLFFSTVNAQPFDTRGSLTISNSTTPGAYTFTPSVSNHSTDSVYLRSITFAFSYDLSAVTNGSRDSLHYNQDIDTSIAHLRPGYPLIIHTTTNPEIRFVYSFTTAQPLALAAGDTITLGSIDLALTDGNFLAAPFTFFLYFSPNGPSSMLYSFTRFAGSQINAQYYRWTVTQSPDECRSCLSLLDSVVEAKSWALNGNNNTNPSTNFIGTSDSTDVTLKANNRNVIKATANKFVTITSSFLDDSTQSFVIHGANYPDGSFQVENSIGSWFLGDANGNVNATQLLIDDPTKSIYTQDSVFTNNGIFNNMGPVTIQDGTQGTNKILISDADGNSHWATNIPDTTQCWQSAEIHQLNSCSNLNIHAPRTIINDTLQFNISRFSSGTQPLDTTFSIVGIGTLVFKNGMLVR